MVAQTQKNLSIMATLLKYGVDISTKEEGWVILNRNQEGRVDFIFIPNTEQLDIMQRINFLKKGVQFTSRDAKSIKDYNLALYHINLFQKDEYMYIKFNDMIVGNTSQDNNEFWIKQQSASVAF